MLYRQSIIEDSFSIATSGTKSIDVVGKQLISRLTILPKITNPNAWVAQGHPDEAITKIEVLDGSNVIVSLEGTQAKALDFYSTKKLPLSSLNYSALQWSFAPIHINFGRYLYDRELALDPNRFNNLQIKITHDLDAAMTGTTVGYITIMADVFEDTPPSPVGFLRSKEFYALTLVANAVTYIDLPEDEPIRILMSHCFSDSQAPEYQIDSLKLTEAHDKQILIDSPMEEYAAYIAGLFPAWTEKLSGRMAATDVYFWVTPAYEQTIQFAGTNDTDGVLQMSAATGGQRRITEASAATEFEAVARGYAPHGSLPLIYPWIDDMDKYWNVESVGGGRLKVTAAAAPDTTPSWDVITQQLVHY
jgi:hypothetical protein